MSTNEYYKCINTPTLMTCSCFFYTKCPSRITMTVQYLSIKWLLRWILLTTNNVPSGLHPTIMVTARQRDSYIVMTLYSYTQLLSQLSQAQTPSGNQRAISFSALSTESLPWQMFLPTSMQKSPRMVPHALSVGMVAPSIFLPSLTALAPSQTIAPACTRP